MHICLCLYVRTYIHIHPHIMIASSLMIVSDPKGTLEVTNTAPSLTISQAGKLMPREEV